MRTLKTNNPFGLPLNGRSLLLGAASSVALCMSVPGVAMAQDDPETVEDSAADDTAVLDTVVVQGIRSSLSSSQSIKENADTFVDAITAEDIGALPDRSVAESLQRVPGVNITRFAKTTDPDRFSVEGSGVIIRGLPFVRSELNGRDVFSAESGTVLSFNDISPELLASVQVYKNATADMIDGGISGTVNLETRKPLNDRDGWVFAGTVDGNYGDKAEEWAPAGSFILANTAEMPVGTFGFQLGYSRSELLSQADVTQITDPCYRDPMNLAGQACIRINDVNDAAEIFDPNFTAENFPPDGTVIIPQGAGLRTTTFDRDREAISLIGQWESPDRTMLLTGEYLKSEAEQLLSEYAVLARVNGNIPAQPAFGTEWEYDSNGDFLAGQITQEAWRGEANCGGIFGNQNTIDPTNSLDFPCVPTSGFDTEMLRFEQERRAVTEDFSLQFQWNPNDRWSTNFELQNINSDLVDDSIIVETHTFRDIAIDLRPEIPTVQFVLPSTIDGSAQGPLGEGFSTNPDYTFYGFALDNRIRNEAELSSFRADTEYDFLGDLGPISKVRFGARWAERQRVTRDASFSNWGALSAPWGGCCEIFGAGAPFNAEYVSDFPQYAQGINPFADFQGGDVPVPFDGGLFWGGPTGSLINAYQSGEFQQQAGEIVTAWEEATFAAGGYVIPGWRPLEQRADVLPGSFFREGEISDVTEETQALYGRADFDLPNIFGSGMDVDGNFGVRYVETTIRTGGDITFPSLGQFPFQADLSDSCGVVGGSLPAVCELSAEQLEDFLSIATGEAILDDADIKFDNWLPSFNAKLQATDDLLFRVGISKGIFRPDLASYKTGGTIGDNLENLRNEGILDTGIPYQISTGNRLLTATESLNYDLSAEWYFDDVGSLTFSVFYKDLENIETRGVSVREFTNSAGESFDVQVLGPSNDGTGELSGYEVTYQQIYDMLPHPFDALGVQATYTYVDGSDINNTVDPDITRQTIAALQPFAGISEDTFNLAAFYETDLVSARLAYNYRSEYLITPRDDIFPYSPIFVEPTGQLDGSIFYTVNDRLKVGLLAVNLLNEITETSQVLDFDGTRRPRSFVTSDRRYTVSARFNF